MRKHLKVRKYIDTGKRQKTFTIILIKYNRGFHFVAPKSLFQFSAFKNNFRESEKGAFTPFNLLIYMSSKTASLYLNVYFTTLLHIDYISRSPVDFKIVINGGKKVWFFYSCGDLWGGIQTRSMNRTGSLMYNSQLDRVRKQIGTLRLVF